MTAPSISDAAPTTTPATQAATSPAGEPYIALSWFTIIAGVIFLVWGFVRMSTYDEFSDKIVGGDAYNYTILATRGVGLIGIGAGLCTIAVAFAVMALWSQGKRRGSKQS